MREIQKIILLLSPPLPIRLPRCSLIPFAYAHTSKLTSTAFGDVVSIARPGERFEGRLSRKIRVAPPIIKPVLERASLFRGFPQLLPRGLQWLGGS